MAKVKKPKRKKPYPSANAYIALAVAHAPKKSEDKLLWLDADRWGLITWEPPAYKDPQPAHDVQGFSLWNEKTIRLDQDTVFKVNLPNTLPIALKVISTVVLGWEDLHPDNNWKYQVIIGSLQDPDSFLRIPWKGVGGIARWIPDLG